MDGDRFDRLTRLFAGQRTRRSALKALAGTLAAGVTGVAADEADAARCRKAGEICRKGPDCCSGTCGAPDKYGRRRCQCRTATDCPTPNNHCNSAVCLAGVCGTTSACTGNQICYGSACCTPDQPATTCAGKCGSVKNNCGQTVDCGPCCVYDEDCASDPGSCVYNVCAGGACTPKPLQAGVVCSQNGGAVCDGSGNCVQCNTASDCGTNTACRTYNCTNYTCGVSNTPAGYVVANPVPGDCRSDQCDGNGNITTNAVDNNDLPADDGNQCTSDTCVAGSPSHPAKPSGATCSQNGGSVCDGAGNCVQCLSASQCPGQDTTCQTRTCNGGICGTSNAISGTACIENGGTVCDGTGDCVQCVTSVNCSAGDYCSSGVCVPCIPGGGSCSTTNQCCGGYQCQSNFCVNP